jgi:hypothetical protein
MNPLAQVLVEEILGENTSPKKKIVGMFGGGFKPPTSGHLEVVKKALQENPEMDALIILVGSGTRDSISQEESLAIWNIYKKSLPNKVVVMASPDNKPPIGAIYSYAKKNPEKEIYWFIGEREGNKDDFYDFIKRTRALRKGDYTNIQAKKITTADAVSGTKARKALLAKDKETFIQFIPNIPEVDEIWDMLTDTTRRNVEEDFDQQDVEDLDNLADRELNPIDIDLSGNHFFDRLNDPRNKPEIDYLELENFFTKLGDNRKEFIDFLNKYKSVVATDTDTDINIPFMKMANKAIAKTIMRKRNFQTPNVKVELEEEVPQDVINSFDIQDTLVPEVWDNEKLKPEVREKLLEIAQDFFESLDLPEGTQLKDIKLTGSLANYNWSKFSDFDLHLVLDFSEIDDDEEFVRNYFMAKKGIWNDAHDINIYNFPVEVYVENEGESHTASGLYSILKDEWIVVPKKKEVMIDKDDITTKAEDYISQFEDVQKLYNDGEYEKVTDKVDKIKERLRDMRSSGLEKGGEYSVENLAFKVLRRADIIGQLNDLKSQSYDTMMSLSEDISPEDFNTNIISLTQYMDNNGLNLRPYPKVKFIDDDTKNAEDLLGRTAYYNPNTHLVALYTLNRHPKDILRSYAHELVHHHQNLSNTLDHSNTTNTNEDGDLEKIEREAYETGNILFRKWGDEKKNILQDN